MANVDFTLEDIRNVVREEIDERVPAIINEIVPRIVDERIDARVPGIFANEFEKIWEGNLEPAFNKIYRRLDTLEGEMKSVKRVVNQHSAEIMELKAKLA